MRKKKEKSISNKIFGIILVSLFSMTAEAQTAPQRPRMVVGIMVEGLNSDYLTLLDSYFGQDGFKRLMREGTCIADVDYGTLLDPAAATAMIYTGTTPSVNGIPASRIYNPESKRVTPALLDPSKIGNYTDETYSPAPVLVSTLGDEVRLDALGTGWVYSIAPSADMAIIMAGHAGNSAFWIDDKNERWATTTYYKDVPTPVNTRNYRLPLASRLDTMSWEPALKATVYPDVPDYKAQYPYRHTFPRKDVDRITRFKASPKANAEVTSLACDYLNAMQFGSRGPIDMLNIAYTVAPYPYSHDSDNRLETLDSYIRLDRELATLFATLDRKAGAGNSLVFLVGHPAQPTSRRDDEKWGVPTGVFSPRKAISLLNAYLMALHGNGEWVSGYYNRNFYLNQRTIKDAHIDVSELRSEAAEFLERMSGVSQVFTIDDIIASRAGDNAAAMKRNTSVKHSGDLIVNITPGWEIVDDFNLPGVSSNSIVHRDNFVSSPAFLMGPGVPADTKITVPADARAIAPTVARLLRIRSPNGASVPALSL